METLKEFAHLGGKFPLFRGIGDYITSPQVKQVFVKGMFY